MIHVIRVRAWPVLLGALALALVAPIALVVVMSFSAEPYISFPPESWGLRQYSTLVRDDVWSAPLVNSLVIAGIVSAVSCAVGVAAALAIARSRIPGRALVQGATILPLLVPGVVLAIGAYGVFSDLGLAGTGLGFVLAHTLLAVPFVVLVVSAALARVPRELELAAISMGAGRGRALRDVTIPILAPAILASALFSFSLSMNEVVVSNFLAGIDFSTIPVVIYASLRIAVEPVVMAIATLLALLSAIVIASGAMLREKTR